MLELLDIKTDYIFKLVFGDENDKSILISFLNAVLKGRPRIKNIELRNSEIAKVLQNNRTIRLDIKAEIENSHYIDIEIQVRNTGEIIDRGIQYACNMMTENSRSKYQIDEDRTVHNYSFPKVIGIWILGESINQRISAVNEACMIFQKNQMDDYQIASDKIRLITIELPKFNPKKRDRRDLLDAWMTFLKNPLDEEVQNINEIHHALKKLQEVSAKDEVREIYELRKKTEEGYVSEKNVAINKALIEGEKIGIEKGKVEGEKIGIEKGKVEGEKIGIEKGEKIGIEKGEKIGIEKGKALLIKDMLARGLSIDDIANFTGMSPDSIRELS